MTGGIAQSPKPLTTDELAAFREWSDGSKARHEARGDIVVDEGYVPRLLATIDDLHRREAMNTTIHAATETLNAEIEAEVERLQGVVEVLQRRIDRQSKALDDNTETIRNRNAEIDRLRTALAGIATYGPLGDDPQSAMAFEALQ